MSRWQAGTTVGMLMFAGVCLLGFGGFLLGLALAREVALLTVAGAVLLGIGQLLATVATIAYGVRLGTRP